MQIVKKKTQTNKIFMVGLEAMLKLLISVSEYNFGPSVETCSTHTNRNQSERYKIRKTNVKFKKYESTSVPIFDTLIPAKTFPI